MSQRDFNVAIVGGGVCGLTCAIALLQKGINVEIFDAAVRFPFTVSSFLSLINRVDT